MANEYVIYTKRIAYELRKKGFKLIRTGINPNFPQYITYIFQNSEAFQQELSKYKNK